MTAPAGLKETLPPLAFTPSSYRHRDELVVIDDVDSLYSSRNSIRLLKCLCQTEEEKRLAWHSAATGLKREGIPREFSTKSRVIIIANDWRILNRNVEAVQDRGHMLLFEPPPKEVHAEVAKWFDDTEILDWFKKNLPLFEHLSMREFGPGRRTKASRPRLD